MKAQYFFGLRGEALKIAMVAFIIAPAFLCFGYNNGSTGGVLDLQSFVSVFPRIDTTNGKNARVQGAIVGLYDIGAVFGALSCIAYGDVIGRLRCIFLGAVLSIIGLVLEASSYSLGQLIVARLVVGASIGVYSSTVPVWQAECSGTTHRGAFVVMEGCFISSGITLSEWISYGLFYASSTSIQWRITLAFPIIFSIVVLACLKFAPESPRWLLKKGRVEDARMVLSALRDEDPFANAINTEIGQIQASLQEVTGSLRELFRNTKERILHRTALAMMGQAMQQLCGISALVFYTHSIFQSFHFSSSNARILGCGLVTFQTLCTLIALFTIDRFGRRALLMTSGCGLCVCMAVMAGTTGPTSTPTQNYVATVFVFLYDLFYPIGFLGLTFLYATEVAPLRFRVPITAIANATQWLCQFVIAQVTPIAIANIANRYWIVFAILNGFFVPIVYFFFPETASLPLEAIDAVFLESKNALAPPRVSRLMRKQAAHAHTVGSDDRSNEKDNANKDTVQLE